MPPNDINHPNPPSGPTYPPPSFIDPATLMQIQSLELRAKAVVEGFFNGLHRSPYHGFSVEFTEYRQYAPGDDLRYLDWKLYARSDRFYIKRYEDETNLRCHLLVDNSKSMSYGSLGYTKSDYAKTLAGTFAYFINGQRDAVGLLQFSESLDEYLPARFRPGHFKRFLHLIENAPSGKTSGLISALERTPELVGKRGLIVVLSDFLLNINELETQLSYLRSGGHEVVLFQILDPMEANFNFESASQFIDLETGQQVFVNPRIASEQYLAQFSSHQNRIQHACEKTGTTFQTVLSNSPLEIVLGDFLKARSQTKQRR